MTACHLDIREHPPNPTRASDKLVTMSQSQRLISHMSIPLRVETAGSRPVQGTSSSCGIPDGGGIRENGRSAATGFTAEGGTCTCPPSSSDTSTHPCLASKLGPAGRQLHPPAVDPGHIHSMPGRLTLSRHDTVGYTDYDGQGQVWCDGRARTHPRQSEDSLRPLSPGSSAVAVKSLLSSVARLEDFEKEEIGRGFFSDVYKVRHKQTGQVLVLKMNNSESSIASVIQEIQLLKKLQHPNIIKLLGVCVHEANIHALIEYINGGDLSSLLLDDKVHLTWLVRMALAKDIASGLSYLHLHSVIHRDLTSMNCLVRKNSNGSMHALVADLGLAARIPRDRSEQLETVGTPFWVSPENLKGHFYTEKTDLFSFGIILCEIIARITANPDELPRLHNFGLDVDAFRMLSGNCPEQLLQLAFSCCDMEPSKRPAFTEVVLGIRNIEADFARQTKRPPTLSGRLRSQSTVIQPFQQPPLPEAKARLMRSPRNSVIRSNSDSGSRPRRLPSVSKKWVNPFDTPHLKNGRTKLTAQASTALFELPVEILESLQAMCMDDEEEEEEAGTEEDDRFTRKRSKSLPNSPIIHRTGRKFDENTNYLDSGGDFSEELSVADRRKTLSPGFVPPTWLEGCRSRSKTMSELSECDSGLGLLCDEQLGQPEGVIHRHNKIMETLEDA